MHGQANPFWFELHYYPFIIISLDRCDVSCNTFEHPLGSICVSNKMEEINLKIFNMIKEMNQSHLKIIFHISVDVILIVENVIQDKNGTMMGVSVNVKTQ